MNFTECTENTLIVIRGAGDLATGTAIRLFNSGFTVVMLDLEKPTVIRRAVSFAQAMFDGQTTVEGVKAVKVDINNVKTYCRDYVQVVADPEGLLINKMKPQVLIDAIIAKKNLGTRMGMAPIVIGLGPGFTAGTDCHAVIETQRGHNLGRIIYKGRAEENTGIPGLVGGYGKERVIRSTCCGVFRANVKIGDIVKANDIVAYTDSTPLYTSIGGKVRGMLYDGLFVTEGFKVADIDPRSESIDHTLCSDKARTVSGGVLEAVMHFLTK